jgi:hypothetical protein
MDSKRSRIGQTPSLDALNPWEGFPGSWRENRQVCLSVALPAAHVSMQSDRLLEERKMSKMSVSRVVTGTPCRMAALIPAI